ncbi:MAG: hypothetical protein IJ479_03355 [Alphaproteobacteria bacterium]|nr:hypothetical protein [Alphaproteobacteria bacterium]
MFDNNNSDNGQRRLHFNFGKKFKRKPYNHELSYQENMMNLFNDYRQWQQDNPQPDCSNMSTREVLEAIVSDFRAQQREEEEAKKAAQMQTPYGSAQTSYVPTQGSYGMQQNTNMSPQRSYVPAGQATYGETEQIGATHQDIDMTQESGWQNIVRNPIDSELTPIPSLYSMGEQIGELTANAVLGAKYVKEMKNTGNYLVNKYGQGIGTADGIDDYYHPLLQCYLAQISPQSGRNGLMLGYAKEHYYDYPKKYYWYKMPKDVIIQDLEKDLANNQYGHDMGRKYPNKSCIKMLEHLRPPRMKKEGLY